MFWVLLQIKLFCDWLHPEYTPLDSVNARKRPTVIGLDGSGILQKARPGQRIPSAHFGLLHGLPLVKPTLFLCSWQSVNRGQSVKVAAVEESSWSTATYAKSMGPTLAWYGPGSVIWTSLNSYITCGILLICSAKVWTRMIVQDQDHNVMQRDVVQSAFNCVYNCLVQCICIVN